jgi:DNA invertase Pin-like site-specific DNA recombinase
LLAVIEQLEASGAHFRSLRDPIDTSTPQGMFSLQVLGAVAQLERALIAERTQSQPIGRAQARSRGRQSRPSGPPEAIRKVKASRVPVLNHGKAVLWSVERLRRMVRRLAFDGIIKATLLNRASRNSSTIG